MNAKEALIEACMLTEAVSPEGDPKKVINELIDWHISTDRYLSNRSRVNEVRISNVQVGERIFNRIKVVIGGLHLTCDLTNDREIKLAKRIADDFQAWFLYDNHNAERCKRVLNIT